MGIVGKHLALAGLAEHVAIVIGMRGVSAGSAAAGGLRLEHAAGDGRLPSQTRVRDEMWSPFLSHFYHDLLGDLAYVT